MKEIWADIIEFNGCYQISNMGRVRSTDRYVNHWRGGKRKVEGKIKTLTLNFGGYLTVGLCENSRMHTRFVHRLVAIAFVPNPSNYDHVNHIDENKLNNTPINLEWCTHKYNMNYGTRTERATKSNLNHKNKSKMVSQSTLDGDLIAIYPSTKEAMRQTGLSSSSISTSACGGRFDNRRGKWVYSYQYAGYKWEYI